ncbi:alcohol dehydrogenase catalytic domain-containing protein [Frankia gtarii]|uniref:alcohol dehydrogenase catalytic domain-containing protein n=1 Tax=Frankia gtarii TaxID=2950102 RepID=UPI0021BEECB3|nr:zinc-binding dehydrogenase [Frankia gtarii]
MRAVTIGSDKTLGLQVRPDPVAGPNDVVVRVRAAGLNAADLQQAAGHYQAPAGWPADVPGLEVAGEVEQVGAAVTGVARGDRVMALIGGGGQAERVAVPADLLVPVPETLSWAEAAGFPEAFSTAWDALVSQAGVRAGDRVLVTGAAGGVGTAMLQIAAVSGAHVVASVRRTELHEPVKALLGGTNVDVITPDGEKEHGPYNIIVDLVGGEACLDRVMMLARQGTLMVVGLLAPVPTTAPWWLGHLLLQRCRVIGTTIRGRTNAEKATLARDIAGAVVPLLAAGRVRVPVDSTFPLEKWAEAYERLRGPGKLGKIVLAAD